MQEEHWHTGIASLKLSMKSEVPKVYTHNPCVYMYSALHFGCPAEIGNRQLVDVTM